MELTKEQRNFAWASLPKYARDVIRDIVKDSGLGIYGMFDLVFGGTINSDIEPEEMLMVSRKKVQDMRSYNLDVLRHDPTHKGAILLEQSLKRLFGDKCFPDIPIPSNSGELNSETAENEYKPKFKVGDKVRVVGEAYNGVIAEIVTVDENDPLATYKIDDFEAWHAGVWFTDEELEPYTEESRNLSQLITNCDKPEPNPLNDMESNSFQNGKSSRTLYEALWELEKASANVRKALVEFENGKEGRK